MFSVQVGEIEDDATTQTTLQYSSHTLLLKNKKRCFYLLENESLPSLLSELLKEKSQI